MAKKREWDPTTNYSDFVGTNNKNKKHDELESINSIIPDKLFLGNKYAASNEGLLRKLKITHIVNVTPDVPCYFPRRFKYLNIGVSDGDPNLKDHLDEAINFIDKGTKVFVHCERGISRSGSIVTAYLMNKDRLNLNEALANVQSKRAVVNPNLEFWIMLKSYEDELEIPNKSKRIKISK